MHDGIIVKGETLSFACPHCQSQMQIKKNEDGELFLGIIEVGLPLEIAREKKDKPLHWLFGKSEVEKEG